MYIGLHNHTDHSNYRMLDSMNRVEELLLYTNELGHKGIAITDHETVGAHGEVLHLLSDFKNKNPDKWKDYKLILGNEIYLCNRKQIQEEKQYIFPHFILLAKNLRGHKALRELSTRAWCENSFMWVNLRVPTFYDDLFEVMNEYKGDVIGSTACAGGAAAKYILAAHEKKPYNPDLSLAKKWLIKMDEVFGHGNFFLELQPSIQEEQDIINKYLIQLSEELDIPYIITTDAHYLKKEDRKVHEAFLNSQDADREVADFYATTYVMSEEEIHEYLDDSLGYEAVEKGLSNTMLIYDMVEEYSLDKPLNIPYIPENTEEPSVELYNKYKEHIPLLEYFYTSKYESDRHLVREVLNRIESEPETFTTPRAYQEIQICFESIKLASEKQNTPWSAYLLQTKELINVCWESGSLVGPLRGSAGGFVLLYMLDIIQVCSLKEEVKLFPWRFLNPERVSPLDIDVDVQGSLRENIIKNLQEKYGGYRHITKVQTLLKAKAKNAIQIACRGLGYTNEEGAFLGSFIKAERGTQFTLHQTYYGDEENNLLPDSEFNNLMNGKYANVWEVAQRIEGLCVGTGQHAGGVILCKEDLVDNIALMKTKGGDVTTQYDLHMSENFSLIKWDLLGVDCLEKIRTELDLLIEDGVITPEPTLKQTYEKYLGVYSIDRYNDHIWDMIDRHEILSLFQFEKQSGYQAIELGKPRSLEAMSALNSIMRLMAPSPEAEAPLQKYSKFQKDISLWYQEMDEWGLTKDEQKWVEQYALKNYGFLPNQENFMEIVQDPMVGGFNLLWADKLRKSIAKKNPKAFNELQEEFFANMREKNLSVNLCNYVWLVLISANKGYGFNTSHTLGYSIVALQEANLAYHYPTVYWNCANLIADSGGQDGTVRYGKIAAAVGRLRKEGVEIALPNINKARFDFKPDAKSNKIYYGFKAINGIGADVANAIVANQPYTSMQDFYNKMQLYKESKEEAKFGETAMIQLIKAGAFDELENRDREELLKEFITSISSPIKKVTASNIPDLYKLGMFTEEEKKNEIRLVRFKKYVLQPKNVVEKPGKTPTTFIYKFDSIASDFLLETFPDLKEVDDYEMRECGITMKRSKFEKLIDKKLEDFMEKITTDKKYMDAINKDRFENAWRERCKGNVSRWEMDALNYYYHDHELAKVNYELYNIHNFDEMPLEPEVSDSHTWNGKTFYRYKLMRIFGTVIDKDANHNTVTLLTPTGVVVVRFYKGQFGFYAREIAVKDEETGKKTVMEKSWFKRGTQLLITGFRNGEQFIPKVYKDSFFDNHSVQLITGLNADGSLSLRDERYNVDNEVEIDDAIQI